MKHTFVIVRGREASVTVVAEEPVRVGTSPFSSIYNGDRGHPPNDLGGCGTLGVHGSALLGWDCKRSRQLSAGDKREKLPRSVSCPPGTHGLL